MNVSCESKNGFHIIIPSEYLCVYIHVKYDQLKIHGCVKVCLCTLLR